MNSSSSLTRSLTVSAALGLAAAGVWMWQVRPLRQQLATLSHSNAMLEHELKDAASPEAESKLRRLRQLKADADVIAASSPRASDLYERYRACASASGVRLSRIDPTSIKPSSSLEARSGYELEAAGFDLQVDGPYANVIDFIEALEGSFGLARITSLRVSPELDKVSGKTLASATIQAVHTAILGRKVSAVEEQK